MFIPNNDIIRGAMAIMVAGAANYVDNTSGRTPSFNDMNSSNFAFRQVEQIVMHAANAPFPPAIQPSCSHPQPCFYAGVASARADDAMHIFGTAASNGFGQVFPYSSGNFTGASALVTTANPSVPTYQWVASPVGATNRWGDYFIESGFQKWCNPTCAIHPYENWNDAVDRDPSFTYRWDTTVSLAPNGYCNYQSYHVNTGQWVAQYSLGSGWQTLVTSYYIGETLPYVFGAGETSARNVGFGSINILYPAARVGTSWGSWVYDNSLTPWRTGINDGTYNLNGSVTSTSSGWTVNY